LASASFSSAVSHSDTWEYDLCPPWPIPPPSPWTPPNPCLWWIYGPTPFPWKLLGFGPDPVDFTIANVFSETDRRKYFSAVLSNISKIISNKKIASDLNNLVRP